MWDAAITNAPSNDNHAFVRRARLSLGVKPVPGMRLEHQIIAAAQEWIGMRDAVETAIVIFDRTGEWPPSVRKAVLY